MRTVHQLRSIRQTRSTSDNQPNPPHPRTEHFVEYLAVKLTPLEALKLRRYHKKQIRLLGTVRR